jgi:pimeloyl-ACP methyl ester carboxylesterase
MDDGPGLVVVHGSGVGPEQYRRLATALGDRFTVHRYDRPGGPVDDEVARLAEVLEETGSQRVFGHSYGGFVALEAALRLPLAAVALFDPAVSIGGSMPTAWLGPFADAVERGDNDRAFAWLSRGTEAMGPAAARLPIGFQALLGRLFLRTPIGAEMGRRMPASLAEVRTVAAHDGPATRFATLRTPLLVASGSHSPAYLVTAADRLAAAVPGARRLVVAGARHDAPNIARPAFTTPVADFLAERHQPVSG